MLPITLLIMAAVLIWQFRQSQRRATTRATARAQIFSDLAPLFDQITSQITPSGFPRLTATSEGLNFDLQLVQDSLTFRKLPTLWLMLTLPEPQPVTCTLHIMARPTGFEPFSTYKSLHHSTDLPIPEHCVSRCDDPTQVPASLARHCDLFGDPMVKELVVSPKGLRIVLLADEADRSRYLIFRDAELGLAPLPQAKLQPALARLKALRSDLIQADLISADLIQADLTGPQS